MSEHVEKTTPFNSHSYKSYLPSNPTVRYGLLILVVAVVYFVSARAGLLLAFHHTNATSVWAPSGIGFAAILLFGYRAWPGITIGAMAVNMFVFLSNNACDLFTATWVSSLICIGNTAEALIGYRFLKKITDVNHIFQKATFAFRFLLVSFIMCLVSSAVGPAVVCFAGIEAWQHYPMIWFTWWLGDVAGVLIVTPLLLTWAKTHTTKWLLKKNIEVLLLFLTLISVSVFLFFGGISTGSPFSKSYIIIPLMLWAALRFDAREVMTALAVTSVIAIWGTANRMGPFASDVVQESLLSLQSYISITCITFLILSAAIAERKVAQKKLQDAHNELEMRVEERTTELKIMNESLQQKSDDLIHSNKELEQFAYVASHDLQEPLRIITGFVQLIEKKYKGKLDNDADTFIRFTVDAAARMRALINDLLSYSRVGSKEKEFQKTDCNVIVKTVLANLESSIKEKKAKISFGRLPEIIADELQMTQLFQNIIGNGIKFTGEKIPEIKITAQDKKTLWLFSISDNGIGIQKEYLEKIFVIFQRLHSKTEYQGTGIGLAICEKIVKRHKGEIWAESEEGKGTTFYFTIKK